MAKLLVSVRSGVEALAALAGGADVIDVKEPLHGPLGRARPEVWREVSSIITPGVPVSVALGELNEWSPTDGVEIPCAAWSGLAYAKLGLSNASKDWVDRWRDLRHRLADLQSPGPAWVAVVYIDWQSAHAPDPDAIIGVAGAIESCRGVLFDTWDKSQCTGITLDWKPLVDRVRDSGRFVAVAGSLDAAAIGRLTLLAPDIFAVRGAACADGDRWGRIDSNRVAILSRAVRVHPSTSNRTPWARGSSLP